MSRIQQPGRILYSILSVYYDDIVDTWPRQLENMTLDFIAQEYVKLVLLLGQHHTDYVDAYYGPDNWSPQTKPRPLAELLIRALTLSETLNVVGCNSQQKQRKQLLVIQLNSVISFIRMLQGNTLSFQEESRQVYDTYSPEVDTKQLDSALAELNQLLPGANELNQKLNDYFQALIVPTDKVSSVFSAAITEAKNRSKQYIALPQTESFKLELVKDQVWSGYNWYKGAAHSVIQLNTDFPLHIHRALDLACHEGYPGHHLFNSLIEKHLVNELGWMEYCIYPLFSPISLLAEGSANYGIELTFPPSERLSFERDVLFPLAGIAPSKADMLAQVRQQVQKLAYADNWVAEHYLDGKITKEQAIELLMKYALTDKEKSTQRIRFIEANRAYVINYNLGQDLVKNYVERHAASDSQEAKWQAFSTLLKNPKTASMMRA